MSIQGKVATIINERDLVINKGSDAGVTEGMKFKVIEPDLDIRDPDTGEPLGSISREKIRVKIVEVKPKFSIGKTYETYVDYVESVAKLPSLLPPSRQPVTRVRTLRTSSDTSYPPDERYGFVKIGDPVVEVADDL